MLFGISDRSNFFCMNASTGETAWIDSNRIDRCGAVLDAGSVMLALPSGGELIVFKPDGKRYEEIRRLKVAESSTYAHPVVAGNRIFVKDDNAITLWTTE